MDRDQASHSLEHAWRYFELHAGQRMTVFNFFLFLSGLAAAGIVGALTASNPLPELAGTLALLLSLTSFLFSKLDQRVCFLMKEAELACARAEAILFAEENRLFEKEPCRTSRKRAGRRSLSRMWTYGESFRLVFVLMGSAALIAAVYSFALG